MAKEKQRLSTGKRGPRKKDDVFPPEPVDSLPVKTFRDIEIETLRSNEPALIGLESLIEGIMECREGLAALKGTPKDQAYYSNTYKIMNSLSGLNRTMLEFTKYVSGYEQLRQQAKDQIFFEVRQAFGSDPELAEKVVEFIEEATGD